MSYLRYLCLIALSLPPVVCRRAHVLLTLFVFDRTGGKDKAIKHK
jgi:hypothetical protein